MELSIKSARNRGKAAKPAAAGSGTRLKAKISLVELYSGKVAGTADATDLFKVYGSEPTIRIHVIKQGVSPKVFSVLAKSMARSKEDLGKTLGLSVTTIDRKSKAGENLSSEQSERVVGMAKLIGQVEAMVEESGEPTGFNAAQWVAHWLDEPLPALGGQKPGEYMDTAEGRDLVSNLLRMQQSGAYA